MLSARRLSCLECTVLAVGYAHDYVFALRHYGQSNLSNCVMSLACPRHAIKRLGSAQEPQARQPSRSGHGYAYGAQLHPKTRLLEVEPRLYLPAPDDELMDARVSAIEAHVFRYVYTNSMHPTLKTSTLTPRCARARARIAGGRG